jgi:selenocysteine-specific translation elongation factor
MYKRGDLVLYRKRPRVSEEFMIKCKYDSPLTATMHVVFHLGSNMIDFAYLEDLSPCIESNKDGKHVLTKLEDL